MVIVDTSVAFKWLVEEDIKNTALARQLLQKFLDAEEDLLAPGILLYELGNVLTYKSNFTFEELQQIWLRFQKIKLPIFFVKTTFIERCISFAKLHQITVYDASYVVLAEENNCQLVTVDVKLVNKLRLPYVKLLSDYFLV